MKKLVALTGKTGAGKSTVSAFLKENGAYIIDGDSVARDILKINPSILENIKKTFGESVVKNGELDRKKLAEIAFSTPENTEKLNFVFHPEINKEIKRQTEEAFLKYDVVVVDAAAIIESGFTKDCDLLITVTAPESVRLSRIMSRDNITKEEALRRMNAQRADEFYEKDADLIIHTGITEEKKKDDLKKAVKLIFNN